MADVPAQTVSLPLMDPGAEGAASTDTAMPVAGDVPQPFEAVTVTSPPVAPAVAKMESMSETPVHPSGKTQA